MGNPEERDKSKENFEILFVDDERDVLSIVEQYLSMQGYLVTVADSGIKALELVRERNFDVVFTDLNMPDITGIDLTREIRKKYSKEKLPIVMVTTQDESRDFEAAKAEGINDILRKPFTESQVGEMLKKITGYKIAS